MARILLIAAWLPPVRTGSAVIVRNLLHGASPDELIVAGCYPPHTEPPLEAGRRQIWKIGTTLENRTGSRLPTLFWWAELPLFILRAWHLIRQQQCAAVLGVYPTARHMLAACVAARLARVPFFPYYHNTWVENRTGWRRTLSTRLQKWLLRHSAHVFVMSDAIHELFAQNYPKVVCTPLRHSFVGELPAFTAPPPPRTPCRLVIPGSIDDTCSEAVLRICAAVRTRTDLELTFVTGTPQQALADRGLLGARTHYASVPPEQVASRLGEEDILLLAHGFTGNLSPVEYQTIFPTRTIECLLSRRPIIAHLPPDCFLARFLREHRCAEIVDVPDAKQVLARIDHLRANPGLQRELVANALRAAKLFHHVTVHNCLQQTVAAHLPGNSQSTNG